MDVAEKILSHTYNRQYPLPQEKWKSYQEWHNVLMLHWKIPVECISGLLPPGLEPDVADGHAWVSWLSFKVKNLRARYLPSFPSLSSFEQVNFRTYVTHNGRPGIYLLNVEANKLITVLLNRLITGLPYVTHSIERNEGCIKVKGDNKAYSANLVYAFTDTISDKKYLDYWLTERHCLFTFEHNKLYCFHIHHKEWSLTDVIASIYRLKYKAGDYNVSKNKPDKKHFSKKIKVLLWGKTLVSG